MLWSVQNSLMAIAKLVELICMNVSSAVSLHSDCNLGSPKGSGCYVKREDATVLTCFSRVDKRRRATDPTYGFGIGSAAAPLGSMSHAMLLVLGQKA